MSLESHVSAAEVFWKTGETAKAVECAETALTCNPTSEQQISLRIFIARAESKLGNFEQSNNILRALIDEKVYLPPVILTLFYNNLKMNKMEKSLKNINLMKLFLG